MDDEPDSEKGRTFYYKELCFSFEDFKKLNEENINRIHRGFTQTLIYCLNSAPGLDFFEMYYNYQTFISNLKLLNGRFDKNFYKENNRHNKLFKKVYLDIKKDHPFFNPPKAFEHLMKKNSFRKEFSVYFQT